MNDTACIRHQPDIVVEDIFPHAPETIWKTLTTGELIGRWLNGADRVRAGAGQAFHVPDQSRRRVGRRDSLPGAGGGPERALRLRWKGGHEGNVGYGSPLDTVVTWTLPDVEGNAPRLVHAGFVISRNASPWRPWATAGRRSSRVSAGLPTSRADAARTQIRQGGSTNAGSANAEPCLQITQQER